MKENKIFIDNFYDQHLTLGLSLKGTQESVTLITGFHRRVDQTEINGHVISEVFKALLLHDKIVITTCELTSLIDAFGIDDAISLVKTGKFEFVDDNGFTLTLEEKPQQRYALSSLTLADPEFEIKNSLEWVESRYIDKKTNNNKLLNLLLLNAENYSKNIDLDLIEDHLRKETKFDITNSHISDYLNLSSTSTQDVHKKDIYNILRLGKLNKTLIYSSVLGIDNIAMDGGVKPTLGVKLSPRLSPSPSIDLFDEVFKEVFQKKDIPDLANLYVKKVITINDYIEIISTLGGAKFRQWILDKDYDKLEIEKEILQSNSKISNKYLKYIRWAIPNAIGLINPAAGISTSLADSFIFEKLIGGWHPNFFLDDLLKETIDKKIELHVASERQASVKKRFPNTKRNDKCPCGSGKKFKKCCGR